MVVVKICEMLDDGSMCIVYCMGDVGYFDV